MTRRSYALFGAALAAVAGAVAAVVVLVAGSGGGKAKTLTHEEYLARVQAICRTYDRKLALVPLPENLLNPKALEQAIGRVLPLIQKRTAEERAVEPPPEDKAKAGRAFALSDEATRELEVSRRKALAGDSRGALVAFADFIKVRDQARQAADAFGFKC